MMLPLRVISFAALSLERLRSNHVTGRAVPSDDKNRPIGRRDIAHAHISRA